MTDHIIIVGGGGHAGVVIQAIRQAGGITIVGIADDTLLPGSLAHDYQVLGDPLSVFATHSYPLVMAIGSGIGRAKYIGLETLKGRWFSVVHPHSTFAGKFPGLGCFFAAGSRIGNGCQIGRGVIINTNASLDHDSEIGDFSHLGPGAVTGGHVKIGAHTMIGIGAMIRDHLTIGSNCVIGMGAVVLEDVPDNCTVWGNPGRIVRRLEAA